MGRVRSVHCIGIGSKGIFQAKLNTHVHCPSFDAGVVIGISSILTHLNVEYNSTMYEEES